ncbi:hypothetical protein ACT17_14645 [Mycolicibacterium conceptionense]|uniref:Uncharacterized protein n=1 Tax=Mycolicibacterium conceptionense TaxID=451644 RepID=A0A0J8WWY6_9MYCO|nr:hypothetical protein [Mycolicibacterium conceptionense]KMV17534.1 hypothetical protein ACT17_14645 [Mycolicibacterium conceptionense]
MTSSVKRTPPSESRAALTQEDSLLGAALRITMMVVALSITTLMVMLILGWLTSFRPGYVETAAYVCAAQLVYLMLLFTRDLFFGQEP